MSIKTMTAVALVSLMVALSASAGQKFGADRHVARGIACTMCHGPDVKNPNYPDENTCTQCHPKDAMAAKTAKLTPNPHKAPHNGDCTLCHMQHEPTVNYCAQCHKFDFPKVP